MHIWAVLFWVLLWQLAAMTLNMPILLPGPLAVLSSLGKLLPLPSFWLSACHSAGKILLGFLIGTALGVLLAILSKMQPFIGALLSPPVKLIKATPVVSFIILALVWIDSAGLSIFIPALMVFPPTFLNMQEGLSAADPKLLEMAEIFGVPFSRQLSGIYIPACLPHFRAACSLGLGLCWKSGIAAEVIGLPRDTIGFNLYSSKIYLETSELFAWTIIIILASVLFEKFFMWALDRASFRFFKIGR